VRRLGLPLRRVADRSVHPHMALEFVRWLQKTDFQGHIYFDTFPRARSLHAPSRPRREFGTALALVAI